MENKILDLKLQELNLVIKHKQERQIRFLKWLTDNSKTFHSVNQKLSLDLSKIINAKIKSCFYNCWKGLNEYTKEFNDLKYFEGFVISKDIGIPIDHSWLMKGSEILDPTLIIKPNRYHLKKIGLPLDYYKNKTRLGSEYYGLEIPKDFVNDTAWKKKVTGPFLIDYYLSGDVAQVTVTGGNGVSSSTKEESNQLRS